MSKRLQELREGRAKLIADARKLSEKAATEKRTLTTEETVQFDKMLADGDTAKADITRLEKLEAEERDLASSAGRRADPDKPGSEDDAGDDKPGKVAKPGDPVEYRYKLPNGRERVFSLAGPRSTDAYRSGYRRYLCGGLKALNETEQRAFQADSDAEGGYMVAPQQMAASLIKFVDDQVFVRQYANVLPPIPKSASVGAPSLDTDAEDADWTVELGTGAEEDTIRFGKRELTPHPLAKRVKISNKLIRASGPINAEMLIQNRIGYKNAVSQEKAFLTGTGAAQPLGVFTASNDGIPTTRDVSTGNTSTEIRFDGLINAKYSMKAAYWARLRWLMHRDAVKQVATLKDGEGRYIWQPSIQAGQPDLILNIPLDMSEFAPNTFTTGLYVGVLADWSQYWIVDSLNLTIQVLTELYAETNQTGYISRSETDGMPVLGEAFARVKLG